MIHTVPVRIFPATARARSISSDQTPPPSPKMESLAIFTASSSVSYFMTQRTGPKISSCAMVMSFVTSVNTVGLTK